MVNVHVHDLEHYPACTHEELGVVNIDGKQYRRKWIEKGKQITVSAVILIMLFLHF
jgi:hypothetical protein